MSIDGKSNPPGGSLAPGFRFHPTDEELVSYYLKRKVLSRPFAVDAISDVDLYKVEPWDLPARSRIRSRDTEWYFFGSLDRKYSNRSKTNRATGQGYWKTTGKDRAVRRGARTVGMKKTLVFHVGRAPKGERTNWVMHEYRLEDEDLARAGVPQDAYVVCRIFQKHGPGPQNGAQYGAPFLEEEWEDDNKPTIDAAGGNFVFADGTQNDLDDDHHSDSLSQGQHLGIQNEDTAHPVGLDDDKNIVANAAEHTSLPSQVSLDEVIDQLNEDIYLTELDANMALVVPTRTSGLLGSPQSPPMDDYLELNDFVKPLDVGEYSLGEFSMIESDQPLENLYGDGSNFGGLHGINEFTNAVERDVWVPRQHEPAFVEDSFYLEDGNIFDTTSSSVQADNGNLFFDALSIPPGVEQEGYVEMTDIMDPISSKFSDPDSLEELAAYFDAPEDNNIQSPNLDYTCFPEFSSQDATKLPIEEGGAADLGFLRSSKRLGADDVAGSSSSELTGSRGGQSVTISNAFENPDVNYKHGSSDKTIKGRLISMLGSIASPPALAAEPKAHSPNPAVVPTSNSIHISAGMIHINGLRMKGNREPWSGSKGEDVGILLSYDTARADIHGTSSGFAQLGKMHCSSVSVAVRSGYCLSFLSILFIAVFFKMGFLYFCKVN